MSLSVNSSAGVAGTGTLGDIASPGMSRIAPPTESGGKTFGQFLTDALGGVNDLQNKAGNMIERFATGERMDVHQVMIAMEQASTALALTTQVRNKLIEGYQDIIRTQI